MYLLAHGDKTIGTYKERIEAEAAACSSAPGFYDLYLCVDHFEIEETPVPDIGELGAQTPFPPR